MEKQQSQTTLPVNTLYDIETGCPVLEDGVTPDDDKLIQFYGAFNPAEVKLTKEEQKTPERIEAAIKAAEEAFLPDLRSSSCTNPLIGVVTAIVYDRDNKAEIVSVQENVKEEHLIEDFWTRHSELKAGESLVGWNNHGFDDRFMIQRSIVLGIKIPDEALISYDDSGRCRLSKSLDLATLLYGDPHSIMSRGGIDRASRALGGPGKNGDGAFFSDDARSGDPARVNQAYDYLKNDRGMTCYVGAYLDVCPPLIDIPLKGTDLITPPRSRSGIPMDVIKSRPAYFPRIDQMRFDAKPPVLFDLIAFPVSDGKLLEVFGDFDEEAASKLSKCPKKEESKKAFIEDERKNHTAKLRKKAGSEELLQNIHAIGYLNAGELEVVTGDEREILTDFWDRLRATREEGMAGWGNTGKVNDLIVMRSIANKITPPAGAIRFSHSGYRSVSGVNDLAVKLTGDIKRTYSLNEMAAAIAAPPPDEVTSHLQTAIMERSASDPGIKEDMESILRSRLEAMGKAAQVLLPSAREIFKVPVVELVVPPPSVEDDDIPWMDIVSTPKETEDALLRGRALLPKPEELLPSSKLGIYTPDTP